MVGADEASDDEDSEDEELSQAVLTELRKPEKDSGKLGTLLTISAVAFMVLRLTVGGDAEKDSTSNFAFRSRRRGGVSAARIALAP